MAVEIRLTNNAQRDIDRIIGYDLLNHDRKTASRNFKYLTTELRKVARNNLISGSAIKNLPSDYRQWITPNRKYKVFFKRPDIEVLVVIRIRSSRQEPLTAQDILDADEDEG